LLFGYRQAATDDAGMHIFNGNKAYKEALASSEIIASLAISLKVI